MKTRIILFVAGMLLVASLGRAQHLSVSGKVIEANTKQAIMSANVVLQTPDSVFVAGVSTNDKGSFRIDKVAEGDYRLIVSAVGFRTDGIELQGLSRSVDVGEVSLKEASQQLGEVTVSAANVVSRFDRKLVFPSRQQVGASANGVDLLRNLMLPRLRVNPMDGSVTLNDGSSVQFCINGRKTGKEDVLALQPGDVIRIEYLEDPGLRYGDAGAVVNYVVRRYEMGGSVGLSFEQSPYMIWGEYNLSGKINYKKSEFGVYFGMYPRAFDNAWSTNEETFVQENGITLHRTTEGIPDTYKDYRLTGLVSYNLQEQDNYLFNASLGLWNHNKPKEGFHSYLMTREYPDRVTEQSNYAHNRNTRPSLDLYFQKTLKHKQLLALNVVGTYIGSHNRQTYREWLGDEPVADYYSGVQGNKYSLIGEGIYEKAFEAGRLSAGIKHTQAYSDNTYDGTLQYDTRMKQADTYAYTQYKGKWKKLNYTVGIGVTRSWFRQVGQEDYETYTFNPRVSLAYTFSDAFYARLNGSLNSNQPSLSQLSAVDQLVDSLQIQRGNPALKPYSNYRLQLTLGYDRKKWQLGWYSRYRNAPDVIMEQTYRENGKFIRSYANHHRFQSWENELSVRVGMLWDVLQLSANVGANRYWSDGTDYFHTYTNCYYELEATCMYKRFMAYFMMQNNRNTFFGETLDGGENLHVLLLQYRLGKATVGAGIVNPLADNYKVEHENRNRFAGSKDAWHVKESAHMVFLTFSYNISFGRDYKSSGKKLNNSDTDAGVM